MLSFVTRAANFVALGTLLADTAAHTCKEGNP